MLTPQPFTLTRLQRLLPANVELLHGLYGPQLKADGDRAAVHAPRDPTAHRLPLVGYALALFEARVDAAAAGAGAGAAFVPPRPPAALLDAARFAEFCACFGLVERLGSFLAPVRAFNSYIRSLNLPSTKLAEEQVLPLLPVRLTPSLVLVLLDQLTEEMAQRKAALGAAAGDAGDTGTHLADDLLPIAVAMTDGATVFDRQVGTHTHRPPYLGPYLDPLSRPPI